MTTNDADAIVHKLKLSAQYFEAVVAGTKTFEIRDNSDRDYKEGQFVRLVECIPDEVASAEHKMKLVKLTGREIMFRIGYVCDFEQKPDYVVFSLLPLSKP